MFITGSFPGCLTNHLRFYWDPKPKIPKDRPLITFYIDFVFVSIIYLSAYFYDCKAKKYNICNSCK